MSSQAAYRLGDGAPVTFDSARAIWTAVAREVLEQFSSPGSVTHSDLARQVQQRSGVYTRLPVSDWMPAVLADLDAELTARSRADPLTTAAPRGATRAKTSSSRRPRTQPTTAKRQDAPPAICPTCFMQLPASGRCDTCA